MTMDALTCKDKRLFTKDEDTLSDLTRFIPFESINVLKKMDQWSFHFWILTSTSFKPNFK